MNILKLNKPDIDADSSNLSDREKKKLARKKKKEDAVVEKKRKKISAKREKERKSEEKKRSHENKINRADITNIIPFTYDDKSGLFIDKSNHYIMMIRTIGTNLFGFRDSDKAAFINAYTRIFSRSVGKGQIYSFQIGADVDKYISDYQYFMNNLDLKNRQDLIKYEILREAQSRLKNLSQTKDLVDREFVIILKDTDRYRLESRCNEVINCLGTFQHTYILDFADTYNVLYNYYHPIDSKLFFEARKDMTDGDVMDYLKPTRLGTVNHGFKQSLELDRCFCRVKYVSDFKKQPLFALMSYLATAADLDFSMHFMPAENDTIISDLDKDIKNEYKNLDNSKDPSSQRNFQVNIDKKSAMLDKLIADGAVSYYFAVFVRIKGYSIEQVNDISSELDKTFLNEGVFFRDGVWQPYDMFNYCAPVCADVHKRFYKKTTTDTLGLMYPFIFESLYDSVPVRGLEGRVSTPPVYIGNTLQTNGVVFYDSFTKQDDRTNYNEFIVGNSGMGKTFYIMWLIYQRYALGYKQYIIDVEGKELNKLTHFLRGENVNCSDGDKGRINPLQIRFNIPDSDDGEGKVPLSDIRPLGDHMRFLRTFLETYRGSDSRDVGDNHINTIMDVIQDIYLSRMNIDFDSSAEWIENTYSNADYPIFSDIYDEMDRRMKMFLENQMNGLNKLEDEVGKPIYITPDLINTYNTCLIFIKPLAYGVDSNLFNGTTNINLNNTLINFNISALHNSGHKVLMTQYFNILSYIWTEIISDGDSSRKQLYADEFSVIMDPRCLDIMLRFQSIIKRIRKYYGGFTSATQQISDVLKDSVKEQGEAIIENSVYKFFFGLGTEGMQALSNNKIIPETEKEFIQFAGIGECFCSFGTSTAMRIKIMIDPAVFEFFERIKG